MSLFISLVYKKYAGSIRKEYSHIPHDDYCQRRAKVLHNVHAPVDGSLHSVRF